ncbi:MAG: hypothetical protein E6J07_05525 [Chloroflexi bacterium]|nr:MAG: hypothetical protein E6J07_05525 [Chloroflexota bacterium]
MGGRSGGERGTSSRCLWRHEYRYGGDRVTVGIGCADTIANSRGGARRPGAKCRHDGDDPRGRLKQPHGTTWPPLTIPAGTTPTGGPGVTGQLGTITRSDGSLQVTYKGMPLYFFHSDAQAGDTKGNYTGWSLVKP